MIEMVHNLTRKSWAHYDGPEKLFSRCNLIFGQNGQGKSSLAAGICDEISATKGTYDSIRFYDRDYAKREMRLSELDGIRGVKVNFGKENVNADARLAEAAKEMEDLDGDLTEAEKELKAANGLVGQRVEEIFAATKGSSNINRKNASLSPEELVEAWKKDYATSAEKHPEHDYGSHVGDGGIELQLDKLRGVHLPATSALEIPDVEAIVSIMRKSYEDIDIPAATVVKWMAEGVEFSEGHRSCRFCGAPMDLDAIKRRVRAFQESATVQAQRLLNSAKADLENMAETLRDVRLRGRNVLTLLSDGRISPELESWLNEDSSAYVQAASAIAGKTNDMNSPVDVPGDFLGFASDDLGFVKELEAALKSEEAYLEGIQNDLAIITRGAIGYKVSQDSTISAALSNINAKTALVNDLSSRIRELEREIRDLEASKTDISEFAGYLSEVLGDLRLPFALETHPDGYYFLSLSDTQGAERLSLGEISEGERNVLAFSYFFYTLYADANQVNLEGSVGTIVIDDPITSMDSVNRFYVLGMLKHIMQSSAQVFIFTHSWSDFLELAYRKSDEVSLYEVVKQDGRSLLVPRSSNISPYRKLFKEVYDFSQTRASDPGFEEAATHMPNTMRRVLEEYLVFNCGASSVGSGNIQVIGEALFPDQSWSQISNNQKAKLELLLSVTNLFSHKIAGREDASAVHQCSRFMMTRIEAANKRHFDAMKQ